MCSGRIFISCPIYTISPVNKGNNKITELRTILQRESQNSIHGNILFVVITFILVYFITETVEDLP